MGLKHQNSLVEDFEVLSIVTVIERTNDSAESEIYG